MPLANTKRARVDAEDLQPADTEPDNPTAEISGYHILPSIEDATDKVPRLQPGSVRNNDACADERMGQCGHSATNKAEVANVDMLQVLQAYADGKIQDADVDLIAASLLRSAVT